MRLVGDQVALDCSCEIWMSVVRYEIPPDLIALAMRDLKQGLPRIYQDLVERTVAHLVTHASIIRVFVFDHLTHLNPRKKPYESPERYIKRFEIAYTYDRLNCIPHLYEIIRHDIRHISRKIHENLSQQRYPCVEAPQEDWFDADIYCGRRYNATITHDLDVLLFGCDTIIKEIDGDTAKVITIDEFMRKTHTTSREQLREYCFALGSDYV